jgi:uncharacterized protein (TIGR03437 family)
MLGIRSNLLATCLVAAAPLILSQQTLAQQTFVPTVIATPGSPSSALYGTYANELVRSQNLGSTWTPVYITQAGLPQPPILGFGIDPTNSNTLYVATTLAAGANLGPIWKSMDGGATWAQASSGLPLSGTVGYFTLFTDTTGTYLYIQIGRQLYRSSNGGSLWVLQSVLPTASGSMIIATSARNIMYYIDTATLTLYYSFSEGGSFSPILTVPGGAGATIASLAVPYYDANDLYVTVNAPVTGPSVLASIDNAPFADQSGTGLGPFTQIASAAAGPTYAFTTPPNPFFRSINSGQSWQSLGIAGLQHVGPTAVDPNVRTTLYGVETDLPATAPTKLIQSIDGGNTWTPTPATITPSIAVPSLFTVNGNAKAVAMFNIALEQGASYYAPFTVETEESPVWKTPVTVTALTNSGGSWITLGATSGSTPLSSSITISTANLAPGTYSATITLSAPQSFNQSVSIPVQLTVTPVGALGPGYTITTAAGNGSPAGSVTTGAPTSLAVGDVRAVAIDPSGNVDFSAGNRIWQLGNGQLTVLAGNGVNASNGDGTNPLAASLADPDGIAFDSSGAAYYAEFAPEIVRKYVTGGISTVLDLASFNQAVGAHTLVLDQAHFMLLPLPSGIWQFTGTKLQSVIPTALSNPYSMLEDSSGNLYVSDTGLNQVLEITPSGVVSVLAGTGLAGFGGDGGPANQAMLNAPAGIAFDSHGTLYIADSGNNRIRTVTTDGNIHTIAGSGLPGYAGDGMTADFASFSDILGVAVDASGNVYVADAGNNRLRVLTPQNTPTPQPRTLHPMQGPNVATTLAPGAIFSLYGTNLGGPAGGALTNSTTWPRSISDVSVSINGVYAPLYYVSPTQINGQIPFETAPGTTTALIAANGSQAAQITFPVAAAQPDVLVQSGGTQAVAVNETGAVNTPSTPAHPGDEEVLYLSGIGIPSPSVPTGDPSPSAEPLARTNYPYSITLNGQQTRVDYLGYAPGFPALVQANFAIPAGLTGNLPLVVTVNGQPSAPTIITVQ